MRRAQKRIRSQAICQSSKVSCSELTARSYLTRITKFKSDRGPPSPRVALDSCAIHCHISGIEHALGIIICRAQHDFGHTPPYDDRQIGEYRHITTMHESMQSAW